MTRYQAAIAAFDKANAEDPNTVMADGREYPKELLYAQRMSQMLQRYLPDASEALRLAVRAQHIQRWKSPRSSYPEGKPGYMLWRTRLYAFHAETAASLVRQAGYEDAMAERVSAIVSKAGLKTDAETKSMEDVAGLVFLEYYMADFAAQHPEYDEEKWLKIIRKIWKKMSSRAHEFALSGRIKLPDALRPLIMKAVR